MTDQKPPTQYAGVVGIEPKPIVLTPEPTQHVNWGAVASLPPFQMFAAERMRNTSGKDSHEHAWDYVRAAGESNDELLTRYIDWHTAKGYWPNETPYGGVKQCP